VQDDDNKKKPTNDAKKDDEVSRPHSQTLSSKHEKLFEKDDDIKNTSFARQTRDDSLRSKDIQKADKGITAPPNTSNTNKDDMTDQDKMDVDDDGKKGQGKTQNVDKNLEKGNKKQDDKVNQIHDNQIQDNQIQDDNVNQIQDKKEVGGSSLLVDQNQRTDSYE
jgi:hypothetical protein